METMKLWKKSRLSESHANSFANGRTGAIYIIAFMMLAAFSLASCSNDDKNNKVTVPNLQKPTATTQLTLENAPVMDGSDSTEPLRSLLMCRLLGIEYEWRQRLQTNATWGVIPQWYKLSDETKDAVQRILQNRNTHGSFVSLIDGDNDIIITARGISRNEQTYASEKGVSLLSYPVAKDAFVFLVNPKNPIRNLSNEQVIKIYTGEIRNWKVSPSSQ